MFFNIPWLNLWGLLEAPIMATPSGVKKGAKSLVINGVLSSFDLNQLLRNYTCFEIADASLIQL
jgi:hypothetical protein